MWGQIRTVQAGAREEFIGRNVSFLGWLILAWNAEHQGSQGRGQGLTVRCLKAGRRRRVHHTGEVYHVGQIRNVQAGSRTTFIKPEVRDTLVS